MAILIRAALCMALAGIAGASAAGAPDESELRAMMVYKLMLFVEWPGTPLDGAHGVLLCVVSEAADTARAFAGLAGRTLKGRALQVQRRAALADLGPCNAVYFDRLDAGLLADKLASLAGRPVLTFAAGALPDSDAMISIVLDRQRLAFDVRQPSLRAAGLGLDARVMQLAREVHR